MKAMKNGGRKMELLKIGICDDDVFALGVIKDAVSSILRQKSVPYEINTFQKAENLEREVKKYPFDLLLLDIDMPELDGITLAKRLKEQGESCDIIYVSNREDKVFDSLKVNPFGFIRKNHFMEDVPAVLEIYLKQRKEEAGLKLVFQTRETTVSVRLEDIIYIEGQRKVQEIYYQGQEEPGEVRYSMQELEKELKDNGFLRVHKGYLVNYRHIRLFEKEEILLDNGHRVPLSRRKAQDVKAAYMDLMQNEGNLVMY